MCCRPGTGEVEAGGALTLLGERKNTASKTDNTKQYMLIKKRGIEKTIKS